MNVRPNKNPSWKLVSGQVDDEKEHIRICYGDSWEVVALVAPGKGNTFIVQILCGPSDVDAKSITEAVWKDLRFYLVQLNEPDPWLYAEYHCTTMSNQYGNVHWNEYDPKIAKPQN